MLAINSIQTFQDTETPAAPTVEPDEDESTIFSRAIDKVKSIFTSDDTVNPGVVSPTPTPKVITIKEKTPPWVFAVIGGVGAIVVGSVRYAMFRKPKAGFGKRRRKR